QSIILSQKRRGKIPFQEQEKFALFGPALTSVVNTRPNEARLRGQDFTHLFPGKFAVRAGILRLTTRFTGLLENPRHAQATPRRSQSENHCPGQRGGAEFLQLRLLRHNRLEEQCVLLHWDSSDSEETSKGREEPVVFLGAASYEYQPQVDITFGAASIQMIETTEDEAPAASEEAVRKEQVRPEESVSCITENFQAFMADLSHEESDGEEQLQVMVELVFKRAVQKPHSAAVFSELCQHLSTVK
ncbi:unnamed protein product, partial [Pleuronectes platessa]